MQKKIRFLSVVVAAVLLSAGAAWGQGDFYVIAAGPTAVGTKITSLPYTINSPGFYYLTGNLSYSGSSDGITVNADNVTIDLMGFTLSGPGSSANSHGIFMSGQQNVEIRNGTVSGWWFGVSEVGMGANHRAINVRAINNGSGIYFVGLNHLIKNCNASNNLSDGLFVNSGFIADCVACNNKTGISIFGPGNAQGNNAFNNSQHNFIVGNGGATAILADGNSAFGLSPNYAVISGTTGVLWGQNAGSP